MSWTGPADFFAMGGYGLYVWGSYAVVAACLVVEPLAAARRHRAALATTGDGAANGGASGDRFEHADDGSADRPAGAAT